MRKEEARGKRIIRNSTAEFLVFAYQNGGDGVEVRVQGGTIWLSQKNIAALFDTSTDNVGLHLKNIYAEGELDEGATAEDFSVVQSEGSRQVERRLKHYSLDAIIAAGYRINSKKATSFRQWATGVLRDYSLRGYVLDRQRMENGAVLGEDYFEQLLGEIREIRLSERRFHQKVTDIYATALDYDKDASTTRDFFAKVQNKLHWAVHKHTAAEVIYDRADAQKEHMGLTSWKNAPEGKIIKEDVTVAKNYLTQEELSALAQLVSGYLDFAEQMAKRKVPMTMEDWAKQLDLILQAGRYDILNHPGRITAALAKTQAEGEFEKYRVIQDRLYESDFDHFLRLEAEGLTDIMKEGGEQDG
ncbi:MAG: cell filamentation protein Fic [Clostridia bacterium]|nr:cell filamentation protein Fic [Clostridia bacterium]